MLLDVHSAPSATALLAVRADRSQGSAGLWRREGPRLQGRIVEVKGADDEARVIYDDDMEEWLSLAQERFQWLAPRAQSAGGTPELQVLNLLCSIMVFLAHSSRAGLCGLPASLTAKALRT